MEIKKTSRKFLINRDITEQFKKVCDELGLKKDIWACFFIDYEIDYIKSERGLPTNTPAALKYLEKQRQKLAKAEESIRMTNEFVEKMDAVCQFHNFTRPMFVEFALRNACNRINLDEKLGTQRSDLKPLYILEHSFNKRLTQQERMDNLTENLIVGRLRKF
jgi:hypothetical protein